MLVTQNTPQTEMSATPDKYPQGYFKDKKCRRCGAVFSPKGPSHHYCSDDCSGWIYADKYYKRNYGVGLEQVLKMRELQGDKCAICGQAGFKMRVDNKHSLVVDHCHSTGAVRGLLCHNCNRALGLLGDDVERFKTAIRYLEGATTIPQGSTLK